MKKFKKIIKNQKGLTLIELLAVIVILGIVAAIAVPSIGNMINNSRDKAILAEASSILAGAKLAALDGVCDPEDSTKPCNETTISNFVEGITNTKANAAPTYSITRVSGVYSITFDKFADLNDNTKFLAVDDGTTANKITESNLNSLLK
ncbi:type II secretion system protein [Psychrobacillus soli]|uniref:Type II secretion system protein n=1 Tax=Psychrobacillus soli TaxID=1543965 RepID=A0A544TBR6_9BACI|nr:type II secretion system protein [Psychrobacillus soli]